MARVPSASDRVCLPRLIEIAPGGPFLYLQSANQNLWAHPKKRRSIDQRRASADFTQVVQAWESLTEQQRLTWRIQAESRGLSGYNYFIKVNMRRRRDGQQPAALPPRQAPYVENPVGKLVITTCGRRLKLELEVPETPPGGIVVFASPACNRGLSRYNKWYIRLGWLPLPRDGRSNITLMYTAKCGRPPAGKRVFIRTLVRMEGRPEFPKETSAVVPAGERRGRGPKGA